ASRLITRLHSKIERAQREVTLYEEFFTDDAEMLVIAYGATARSAIAAVKMARQQGVKAGLLRLVTIWPFPAKVVERLGARAYKVLVPELNYGQLICEVERYLERDKCVGIDRVDGEVFKPAEILDTIMHWAGR
ncbi:MAG: 2-oxoacid:acceptor oxidoreductase subunit alpha, partial [Negativicutes bacterium]|nr:2-oxoacid:acceptor oxidoreductase subunit alpha [Negativicutes bacterium]